MREGYHPAEMYDFVSETVLVGRNSALRSGLKTGKKPDQDQTKTGLLKDCSPVFSNFKIKDCKKTGLV